MTEHYLSSVPFADAAGVYAVVLVTAIVNGGSFGERKGEKKRSVYLILIGLIQFDTFLSIEKSVCKFWGIICHRY